MATYYNFTPATAPPNYYDPGDHSTGLIAASGCMAGLTTVSIILRFESRYLSKKVAFWWDDWFALIAWVLLIPQLAFIIDSTHYGIGRHEGTLNLHQWERFNIDLYVGQLFYNCSLTATKFSVLFFYIRVFPWEKTWFRWASYVGFFLCAAWCIAISFLIMFECSPVDFYWIPTPGGTCVDSYRAALGTCIPNVVIDLYLLCVPMPFVFELPVGINQKLGVAVVFFTGYATLALSITRVVVSADLTTNKIEDYTWNAITWLIVINVEPSIALISVCLPAQVYLIRVFLVDICGIKWFELLDSKSVISSPSTSEQQLDEEKKRKKKRRSDRIKSMLENARWRNLSNVASNCSYQAQVFADINVDSTIQEGIEGIQVEQEVTVRPSSWAPQFVQLLLG